MTTTHTPHTPERPESRTPFRRPVIAAALLLTASTFAQDTPLRERANRDQPARSVISVGEPSTVAAPAAPIAEFRTSDGLVVVRMDPAGPHVTINGEPGSKARVRVENGTLTVLGSDGEPLVRMNLARIAPIQAEVEIDTIVGALARANRRIIGVTTNPVPPAALAELGLEGAALVIESVTPGLPAERAGVRPGDLITRIEGATPATLDRLREAIEAAGEKPVRLEFLRNGEPRTLGLVPAFEPALRTFTFTTAPGAPDAREIERRVRAQAADTARQQALSERMRVQVQRLMEDRAMTSEAREEMERAVRAAAEAVKNIEMKFDFEIPEMPEIRIFRENGENVALFAPGGVARGGGKGGPARVAAATETRRIDMIEERLARLERLIEGLLAALSPEKPNEPGTTQNTPGG